MPHEGTVSPLLSVFVKLCSSKGVKLLASLITAHKAPVGYNVNPEGSACREHTPALLLLMKIEFEQTQTGIGLCDVLVLACCYII